MPWYMSIDTYTQCFTALSAENAYSVALAMNGTGAPPIVCVRALNLTPHKISWRNDGSRQCPAAEFGLPSEGSCRVAEDFEEVFVHDQPFGARLGRMKYGLPIFSVELPQDDGPLVLIVSTLAAGPVAAALDAGTIKLPPASLVLVPDSGSTAIRDEQGRVQAVRRFMVAWGDPLVTRERALQLGERFCFKPYDVLQAEDDALGARARREHNAAAGVVVGAV